MTRPIETAAGSRESVFPRSWGPPPVDEEQRAAWVLEHARRAVETAPGRDAVRRNRRLLDLRRDDQIF